MSSFVHSGQGPDGVLGGGHALLPGHQAPQAGRQCRHVTRAGQHHAGAQSAQSGPRGSPHGGSPLVDGDQRTAAPQRAPCPPHQHRPAPSPCAQGLLSPVETTRSPGSVDPGTACASADPSGHVKSARQCCEPQPSMSSRISAAVRAAGLRPPVPAAPSPVSTSPAPSTTRAKSSAFFSLRAMTFSSMVSAETSR